MKKRLWILLTGVMWMLCSTVAAADPTLLNAIGQDNLYYSGQCSQSSSSVSTLSTVSTLVWPFATKSSTQYNRVDQGWDIQENSGGGVYAVSPGTLHVFNPDPGGFGDDYPTEQLDQSIGGPTNWVYYGHVHIIPSLKDKHVNAGQLIAYTNTFDGQSESGAPPGWLEIGFARPNTDSPVDGPPFPTQAGQKMHDILISNSVQPANGTTSTSVPSSAQPTNCCSAGHTSQTPATSSAQVTTKDLSYTDPSRANRPVGATVYLPGDSQPHPLIMFAPGRFQNSNANGFYSRYLTAIAKQGFVVVGANFSDNNSLGAVPSDATDIKFLIGKVESDSGISSNISTANGVGLIGHSDGGMIAMLDGYASGFKDSRLTAVMSEDGAWYSGYTQSSGPPLFLMHGTSDPIQNIGSSEALFSSIQGPYQAFAKMVGADHFHYIVDNSSQYISAVDTLTAAFFGRVLGGDASDSTDLSSLAAGQFSSLVNFQDHGNENLITGKNKIVAATVPTTGTECCDTSSVSGPAGSGPLFGLEFPKVADTTDLANRINKFISDTQPNSPFVNLGSDFVAAGEQYNVNPAMMVGFAVKEQSLGTAQDFEDDSDHNSFGISGNNAGQAHQYPVVGGATYYPSFKTSLPEVADYISAGYIKPGAPYYSTTLLQLMEHYTPNGPNQSSAQQTQLTLDIEHKILDGISTQGGAGTSDGTVSAGGCSGSSTTSASSNGWSLKGAHSMTYFGQCDSRWGNQPYGNPGQATICASGCGITSLTMVVDTLKGRNETPLSLAQRYGPTYHTDGTSWALWPVAAKDFGLQESDLGTDLNKARDIITQGGLVIIAVNPGAFTSEGHIMVIRAIDDRGNFYLADPNNAGNIANGRGDTNNTPYSANFLMTKGSLLHLWGWLP